MRAIAALARADLLERVRRYSFLITLGFVLWLGVGTFDGSVTVRVDQAQGAINAAWVGGMMAVVAISFLTLAGFWVVKNAVDRDERTGVGAILATTPLSRVQYTLGKALSHFLVLSLMVAILVACAIVMLLVRAADPAGVAGRFDLWAFVTPFLFCVVPALAITAAVAIFFETTPILRGGAGNALWFFLWAILLTLSMQVQNPLADPMGILLIQKSMGLAAQAQLGADPNSFSITMNPGLKGAEWQTFHWPGVAWTPSIVASRLAWLAAAVLLAMVAAVPFHRFDPSRRRLRRPTPARPQRTGALTSGLAGLTARLPTGIVGAELRLLLAGANRWWALVAVGLWTAGWLAPLEAARSGVLPAAWLWPLLRWSDLGARDARNGTEAFVATAPRALVRQLPAAWLAGVLLTAFLALGVGARLALAGDGTGFMAWLAGAMFIPAFALALGLLSRGNKLFEVLYTLLWYAGPMNRTPGLDFMGVSDASARPLFWFAATLIALGTACVVRARQLRA